MTGSRGLRTGFAIAAMLGIAAAAQAGEPVRYASVGDTTRAPIGWVEFCADNPVECKSGRSQPRDIVLTQTAWQDLLKVNRWVNDNVKPLTDMEHWGVIEKWSLPTDGYGDCDDYALTKRKALIEAGMPERALRVAVVRTRDNIGHAVLTVATDKGDFVLDNRTNSILAWQNTNYAFVKRQSSENPNIWVRIGIPNAPALTATGK